MSPAEILDQLRRVRPTLPIEALRAADGHRAELTPHLLASLAEVVARPAIVEDDRDLQLPFHAMYLLAVWRERRAHPLLLAFLRLPGEQALDLSGDIITQDMDWLLAQTAGGDPQGMAALARDPEASEWIRAAAILALARLTAWGELPRPDLLTLYREIIGQVDRSGPENAEHAAAHVLQAALHLRLVELRDELLTLMESGRIDEWFAGTRREVADEFTWAPDGRWQEPVDDVAAAISWWACFEREDTDPVVWEEPDLGETLLPPRLDEFARPRPHRAPPKVGRNDPCPCGSGRKHKKCCGG